MISIKIIYEWILYDRTIYVNVNLNFQVLENVWMVLKGNMSLMLSIATAALSIVLGGGTAILNLFISAVSIHTLCLIQFLS